MMGQVIRNIKRYSKPFVCGVLATATILIAKNIHAGSSIKKDDETFYDLFPSPVFTDSFVTTEEMEQYTFDVYNQKMTIQSEKLRIHSFDDEGNHQVENGEKVIVPIANDSNLLEEYVSEREAKVYSTLKRKDDIKDQFSIFVFFTWMEKLYEEYLDRTSFDTLEERKQILYTICYKYLEPNSDYTMGGYQYSELEKTIQADIKEVFERINYMFENGTKQEQSKLEEYLDGKEKALKYNVFKIGRK